MKNNRAGEIATIITIGTLIVISLFTIVSSIFLKNKQTTKTKAEECGHWDEIDNRWVPEDCPVAQEQPPTPPPVTETSTGRKDACQICQENQCVANSAAGSDCEGGCVSNSECGGTNTANQPCVCGDSGLWEGNCGGKDGQVCSEALRENPIVPPTAIPTTYNASGSIGGLSGGGGRTTPTPAKTPTVTPVSLPAKKTTPSPAPTVILPKATSTPYPTLEPSPTPTPVPSSIFDNAGNLVNYVGMGIQGFFDLFKPAEYNETTIQITNTGVWSSAQRDPGSAKVCTQEANSSAMKCLSPTKVTVDKKDQSFKVKYPNPSGKKTYVCTDEAQTAYKSLGGNISNVMELFPIQNCVPVN